MIAEDRRKAFGRALLATREAAALTRERLAAKSGCGRQSIFNWEFGLNAPRGPQLEAILRALPSEDLARAARRLSSAHRDVVDRVMAPPPAASAAT